MDFLPPEFARVPYGTQTAGVCSPQAGNPETFRGIVINIPHRIALKPSEKLKLPICGYYLLPSLPIVQGAVMTVHVRGIGGTSFAPLAGEVVIDRGENEPEVPNPFTNRPINPADYKYSIVESYFFLDGQRYFKTQLPPGNYEVMVSFGEVRSNVGRLTISRE